VFAGRFPSKHLIELIDVPEPVLSKKTGDGPGDIIFEPIVACLCGSDLPYFNGEHPEAYGTIGHSLHEMVGTVLDTNGKKFKVGDIVLAVPVNQLGLYERYAVTEARAIPVDMRLPLDKAIMAQPLGTVIYALKKLPRILDQDVVVLGQGPIGQMFNACLRNLGAREIIGIDRLDSRLKTSPATGASCTINPDREDPVAAVKKHLKGELPDIVIEAVGHNDHVLSLAIAMSRVKGDLLIFGVPPETIDGVRWRDLFYKNVKVHFSVLPDFDRDFPLAMRWLAEGRMDLSLLATHRYNIREIQTAFETFRDRKDGAQKVLLDFPK